MKTIRNAFKTVYAAIGDQEHKTGLDYRKTQLCIEAECPNGRLLYHTLTGELLLLTPAEAELWTQNSTLQETMIGHWFLVPSDLDEIKLCDQVRRVAGLLQQEKDYISNYIIFTTTDCNARCFYCFERGQRRYSMTEQTARDVAAFMLSHANGEQINIRWFGGEPLVNVDAIDTISRELRNHGVEYKSTMVSNAYLFDETIAKRAKELWHLQHVLITIDGTQEVYNRTKAFVYREGNAFQRVLNNITGILSEGINVTARLNMDERNAEDLFNLVDILGRRFSAFPSFKADARLLIDYFGNIHAFETTEQALQRLQMLNERLESFGIIERRRLRTGLMQNYCMADNMHSTTVLPDGRLGRCEHFGDSEEVGSIYGAKDEGRLNAWRALRSTEAECHTCAIYPQCFRLKKCNACPDVCNELFRGKQTMMLLDMIKNTYKHFIKNGGSDETDM